MKLKKSIYEIAAALSEIYFFNMIGVTEKIVILNSIYILIELDDIYII